MELASLFRLLADQQDDNGRALCVELKRDVDGDVRVVVYFKKLSEGEVHGK